LLNAVNLEEVRSKAKALAEAKLSDGKNADEFIEIANADGFKIYVVAGKTLADQKPRAFHANARDVFMLVLEGAMEFTFENRKKTIVKAKECFVLPKRLKHKCVFKKMTVVVEGVYEKSLYNWRQK